MALGASPSLLGERCGVRVDSGILSKEKEILHRNHSQRGWKIQTSENVDSENTSVQKRSSFTTPLNLMLVLLTIKENRAPPLHHISIDVPEVAGTGILVRD